MLLTPAPLRSTVSEGPDGLRIRIPAPRNVFAAIFLIAWLAGWAFGEWQVGGEVLRGKRADLFSYAWLAFWTCFGPLAFYTWLWNLFGADVLTIRGNGLTVRSEILGIHWQREYDATEVRNLRFRPAMKSGRSSTSARIVFDYGARTRSFAEGIDEAEAGQIIDVIRSRANLPADASHSDYFEKDTGHTWLKF